jgi:hypothetical protein
MTTINCPQSWADVKLADYLEFYKLAKSYADTEQYQEKAILFATFNFTDITEDEYLALPESTFSEIQNKIGTLLNTTDLPLVKSFQIEDKKYGFIPSLDDMSYGEYLDLVSYSSKDMWNNIPVVMSTLYRPITKTMGKLYSIEKYNGTNEETKTLFLDALTMDIVFGALSFFLHLQLDLQNATLIYLPEKLKKSKDPKVLAALKDLEKNGVGITQLQSWLSKTSLDSTPLLS